MRKLWTVCVLVLFVAGTAQACGDDSDDGDSGGGGDEASGDTETLDVRFMQPIPESTAFYPYLIADELGYFEEEGLDVELLPSGETETTLQLAAGNIDIGAINPPEIMQGLETGEDWTVFYDFYQANVFSIVTPEGSGIDDVADLEGMVLGITSQGGGELPLVEAALQEEGLVADEDVQLQVVGDGGPQVALAIERGTIDAYAAAIQDMVALEVEGLTLNDITPDVFANLPANSLVMQTSEFETEDGRRMAEGFARAWAKATYVGVADPDFVYEIGLVRVPEETEDETFGRPFFETVLDLTELEGDLFGELGADRWQISQDLLLDVELLSEPIDPETFLDDSVIAYANDFDPTEVEADIEEYREANLEG